MTLVVNVFKGEDQVGQPVKATGTKDKLDELADKVAVGVEKLLAGNVK